MMSDENMKGRERIWEYIHDKIETRLSELEKKLNNLESVLKKISEELEQQKILPISFTERYLGAGGNPKEKVHDMSFQDIDLDKEPTTDAPAELPIKYWLEPLYEKGYDDAKEIMKEEFVKSILEYIEENEYLGIDNWFKINAEKLKDFIKEKWQKEEQEK